MSEERLPREFYARDTVAVAKDLLGKVLVRKIGRNLVSGIITETEAYRHSDDPASHACTGMTKRNEAMFGQVGCTYVYFTYGMHHCVNVVAKKNRMAGAVLIRALEPKEGIDIMMENRKTNNRKILTDGPAKLTVALDITKKQYGEDLVSSPNIYITYGVEISRKITTGPRIGIRLGTDKMWNFKV